ncbi:MAG: C25 family cysteine peptidase [Candidatus Marinimicrobia bacterium]|nr:C25 family cysteine peptidase [Candidatus Neomarinimicrobiota bacterium]
MYKNIRTIIISFTLAGSLFAADNPGTDQTHLMLRSFDENHSVLATVTPEYSMGKVTYASGSYDHLVTEMDGQIRLVGAPDLPSTTTLLAVPATGELQTDYSYNSIHVETNVTLAPFQPVQLETDRTGSSFQLDREIYERDAWFPEIPVIVHDRITMRDLNLVTIEVTPFQYNPVRKELRVYEGLEVTVNHTEPLIAPDQPISRYFEPIYQNLVPNSTLVLEPNYQTPSVLFIHPNNAAVIALLQNLANWRHEKGFEVHLANTSDIGTSNSNIKSYIQTAYDTWDNPPEFVVLVGDAGGSYNIPTWTESWSGYNGEGDHPYVHLAGSDYVSDAFIGRLPFNTTTEFANIISKIMNYEKFPAMTDPTWFTRSLLVGDQSSSGLSTIMINHNINELMEYRGYHDNIEVYNGSFVSGIQNGINAGVSYFNYRGYLGMSGWGNSNTSNLMNGPRLPFVTILTCGTGGFTGDARSEKFLKVGSSANPKGAIAAVGTATSGTHTLYNNCVSMGMYHSLFAEDLFYAGVVLERGRLSLNSTYPSTSGNYVQIFSHWNNLMGDPSLELWTGVPQELTVDAPTDIPVDVQYFDVTVTNAFDLGVEGAWVTLTGLDVLVSGYSDEDGVVALELPAELPAELTLTVTKHNHIPLQSTVTVGNDNFAVLIDTSAFNEFTGNGDGVLNPGEMGLLEWSFSNHSAATVYDILIDVQAEDGMAIPLDIDSLVAGESVSINTDDYHFEVWSGYPSIGRYDIKFYVEADGSGYTDHRRFEVYAPFMQINEVGETGAPPYSFDPGEISDLVLFCENVGTLGSSNLHAVLHCNDPNVEILDSTAVFTDAEPGALSNNSASSFQVNINTQVTVGVQIPFQVEFFDDLSDFSFVSKAFLLPIGTPGAGDPTGPDAGGYFCYSDEDLAYALAPVYDWIEIVPGMSAYVGTLVPLTDNNENQEDIDLVNLPFDFGFYGIDYNQISICSNGYIALGESEIALFRNYPMPSPLGPNPMIAAFWDNLVMGGGDVYTYFNASEHYFVIEYHNMQNDYSNSTEKFEVILYDPDYYGSTDGNGDIKIQYHTYNNNNDVGVGWGSSAHGQYSTTGLKDHTGLVGLQYTYNNSWAETAHVLGDGSALLFTTRTDAVLPCPGWARGDINHDGYRNVQDLIILVNTILGQTTIGECEFWAADMSLDSTISVGDVVLLVDNILGSELTRPTSNTTGQADFILESGSLVLRGSKPAEAFAFTVRADVLPTLLNHAGLTMVSRIDGDELRVLGYWMEAAPTEIELLTFEGNGLEITYPEAADASGALMKTAVVRIPETFAVTAVYPNPFNPTVNISYNLPEANEVSIRIFNALGQTVSFSSSQMPAGEHVYSWQGVDASDRLVSSGIYFARIATADSQQMVKLTLLR